MWCRIAPAYDPQHGTEQEMLHSPGLIDLVRRETEMYASRRERAAYRAGMSTAAAACDYVASELGGKNKLTRAKTEAAKTCGDMIEGLREMVSVPEETAHGGAS